ncbi:MFS transporter [Flexivirga meconopsidis]|uniref:MFS transporter n=1 Tax=Flexivirga meconopsidis TaxID=2977121 RepID=UPI00223EDA0D|nr:MFS transporter [Flexivirga meconopsidis]
MTTDTSAPPLLWRDHRFVTFWAGESVSMVGSQISGLALPLLAVTTMRASAFEVGLLTAAAWAPYLVAIVVGVWVDGRRSKRAVMIASAVAQAAVLCVIPVAHALGALSLPLLLAVALLAGFAAVVQSTAWPPFFVSLVRKEQYLQANSMLSTSRSTASLVGPPLTGGLVQVLGAPIALLADAGSFLVSAITLSRVRVQEAKPDRSDGAIGSRVLAGLRCIRRNDYLRANLLCSTTLNFGNFVVLALVVLFASRTLLLDPGEIGLAMGIGALGALLGAVVATRCSAALGIGRTIACGAVLGSLPCMALPLAPRGGVGAIAVLAGVEFLCAFGIMLYDVNNNAVSAVVTPDGLRSRVSGAFSTINYGVRPLAALIGGAAGASLGVAPTVMAGGLVGALGALWLRGTPLLAVRGLSDIAASR